MREGIKVGPLVSLVDLNQRSLSPMGDHTLRTIGFSPRRCSSSHQSSTFAVGWASLSSTPSSGAFFESLLLACAGRCVLRPRDLRALAQPLEVVPASLLLGAHRPSGPNLDPLAHLRGVPHPPVGRGLL